MCENIIEIKNVSKKFKEFELKNVSLDIPKGCIVGLIGENGAGKSTLIKLILNLLKRDSGDIKIFGMDNIKNNIEIKKRLGVVIDGSNFPDMMKATEIAKVMRNIYDNWDDDKFKGYIKRFSLPENLELKKFSKGMLMKLMISATLSHNPDLLILDEATSGLDPVVRDDILDIFLEFIQDENKSVLISSHITSDLEKISDYISFISNGEIILTEAKDDLIFKYGILKCSNAEFEKIDRNAIIGYRKNQFGTDALVNKSMINDKNLSIIKPTIEDIMLYSIKGEKI